ncbi:hypothetical protein [Cystobacter ferrugineus]|uniref:Uncharacterized protein n=1 Tax=Cystobacter ferrugineus TaxID=83449 RepID=A0A1L9AZ47_9BACT|nr:hypothetical protein [Cystobacter ferrugineus]OJH35274.1 hypothetical protein BON30_40215 [Cystobacter ferrugineus]
MSRHAVPSELRPSLVGALALLGVTSLHHALGAWVYATPWRLHVVGIALVAGLALLGTGAAFIRLHASRWASLALAVFTLLTGALVVWLGLFEGLYNHVLKDVLFLGGASPRLLASLFPPPTYTAPDHVGFEVSGLLQVPIAAWVLLAHGRLLRRRFS